VLNLLEVPYRVRCALLSMLEAAEGVFNLLEVIGLMRCVLFCVLVATEVACNVPGPWRVFSRLLGVPDGARCELA